ncbi:MAG: ABC transporter ATP-binding protein, partial [Halobacteria archaeon]|nr:ABC transporter ATP-binding protein [Halobacteria archaeon]
STTINILLDFVRPTTGEARVLGMDAQDESMGIKQDIGVLPEDYGFYPRLTGRKHLEFAIRSKDADDDPDEILERVGLDAGGRKVKGYSTGMGKRLALGIALVGEPDLLILDEPTSGLDPNGAREVRDIVREENRRGATVFFSSHILEQVEAVCNSVGILREGELVAEGSIDELRNRIGGVSKLRVEIDTPIGDGVLDEIRALDGVTGVSSEKKSLTVSCSLGSAKIRALDIVREKANANVENFTTHETSLEDMFASYTEDTRETETETETEEVTG